MIWSCRFIVSFKRYPDQVKKYCLALCRKAKLTSCLRASCHLHKLHFRTVSLSSTLRLLKLDAESVVIFPGEML